MAAAFQPDDTRAIGAALVSFLSGRFGAGTLTEGPDRITGGRDTYVYSFRMGSAAAPDEWRGPLILRIYPTDREGPKAEREAAAQRFVSERGFSAPRPLIVEAGAVPFGLPFMVMERAPGSPMLDRFKNPLAIPRMLTLLADTQAGLHSLPCHDWPLREEGPLVKRFLPPVVRLVETHALEDLQPAARWFHEHQGLVESEEPAFCHGDFHPLNVLIDGRDQVTVIDWSDAGPGDRHSDVARTMAVFWLAPPLCRSALERTVLGLLRRYVVPAYLRRYERHFSLDERRLRYWQAFHALRAWVQIETVKVAGEDAIGAAPGSFEGIPPTLTLALKSYVEQRLRQ